MLAWTARNRIVQGNHHEMPECYGDPELLLGKR